MHVLTVMWITLVFILVTLLDKIHGSCDTREKCQGQRPMSKEGCCPLLPGDQCGDNIDRSCDHELGYSCSNGTCRGAYNLTTVVVGTTTASLAWSGVLSEDSQYEYTVLYTRVFSMPLLRWNSHGVGPINHVVLRYLTPDTLYYVRVGVWTEEKFENLTEVIFLHTKAAAHCLYNGRPIAVGELLVVECEESCVCHSTGRFECVPVCHGDDFETPVCQDGQTDMCCDSITRCMFDNCTYLGDSVAHAQAWTIGCQENCTCYDGIVTCMPLCDPNPEPADCFKPVLVESDDDCCPEWRCEESEETCSFRNTTYTEGTWVEGDCELCSCSSVTGSVHCLNTHSCDMPEVPETSVACPDPTIISNVCCSQVFCEQNQNLDDLLEVFSVTSLETKAILIRFTLTPATNEADVLGVTLAYTDQPNKSLASWLNVTLSLTQARDISNSSIELTSLEKHSSMYMYKVGNNYLCVISNLQRNSFYYVKMTMELYSANQSGSHATKTFASNTVVIKVHGLPEKDPDRLQSASKPRHDITWAFQAVNISSSSAVMTWMVPQSQQTNISWFVIRYKPLSAREWLSTERLIFSERLHRLPCLHASFWYQAELIAYPGEQRLGPTFFNTSEIKESRDENFAIKFKHVDIGTSSVTVNWEPIKDEYIGHVIMLEIMWSVSSSDNDVFKLCAAPETSQYKLDSLVPGTLYMCWIRVNLHSGKTVFSNRVHFVTTTPSKGSAHSSTSHRHSIILAITVACTSLISITIAIATVAYLTRCRRRASYQSQTSFENKIFQIYTNREDREV